MSGEKYIGLDVHQATISVAVVDSQGKVVMESILETKASTILEFLAGLRGSLFVTFEEGTWADWHYDLLKPHVTEVLVCAYGRVHLIPESRNSGTIGLIRAISLKTPGARFVKWRCFNTDSCPRSLVFLRCGHLC